MPRVEVSPNRCDALGWLRARETGWMMGQGVSRGEEGILGSWDGGAKGISLGIHVQRPNYGSLQL